MRLVWNVLLILALSLTASAADLKLRVMTGSNGFVSESEVDVATIGAGDAFTLELVVENLDFAFAGFEGQFSYPTWLTLVDTTAIGTLNPPYEVDTASLGTSATQKLPADQAGADTDVTFRNDQGAARIGLVITDPNQRPNSGDIVLARFSFVVGRDFALDLSAQGAGGPTCISSEEEIKFLVCGAGVIDPSCPIIADDSASSVDFSFDAADLIVNVNNSSTTIKKGNVNGDASFNTLDIPALVQCIVFGCDASADETNYKLAADMNCDNNVNAFDIVPTVMRAVGLIGRVSKNDVVTYQTVGSSSNALTLENHGKVATVSSFEIAVQGGVRLSETVALDEAAMKDGWNILGKFSPENNVYKYMLVNMKGKDAVLPNLHIGSKGAGQVAIRNVEAYTAHNKVVALAPALGGGHAGTKALRNDR